jgi:Putative adipose-regulatory protein (Seipin)
MPGLHASEKLHFEYEGTTTRQTWNPGAMNISMDSDGTVFGNETCAENNNVTNTTHSNTCIPSEAPDLSNIASQKHQPPPVQQAGSPRAVADLFSRQDQWIAHHPDIVPHPKAQTRILPRNIPHYVEVILDLPESERNFHMGMFGVAVELQSSNGTLLASSVRTARMPHESRWIAVVRKAICIVPLMLGALQESRRVTVPAFRFFVESERLPLVRFSFYCRMSVW